MVSGIVWLQIFDTSDFYGIVGKELATLKKSHHCIFCQDLPLHIHGFNMYVYFFGFGLFWFQENWAFFAVRPAEVGLDRVDSAVS